MQKKLAGAPDSGHKSVVTALLALMLLGAGGVFIAGSSTAATPGGAYHVTAPQTGLPEETGGTDISNRIHHVTIEGLQQADTTLVLSTFQVKPGDIYRIQAVRDGIKALYRLSLFDQVEVLGNRTPEGVDLTIQVVESPRISAVEFHGNKAVSSDKLKDKISGTTGKVASARTMDEITAKVMEVYKDEGYPMAAVKGTYTPAQKPNDRILSLEINEGTKIQVTAIHFVGNRHIPDKDLRGAMQTKAKSFLRKGHLQPEKLEEDMDKLRAYYQRHGFRDVRITDHKVTYSPDGRTAQITIAVDEGPIYTMGAPTIEGNTILATPSLMSMIKFKPGDRYNREKIDQSAGEIGMAYADRGYLYAQVDPEERLDSTKVFVDYKIVEQEPSKVREIQIAGNTRTKEKVIRRQLYLFPGQKFDRSLLIRSQRELFQLGFFEDVQADFKPLPNSYDVDLVLNVKEKAVGTASAGAGFSSQGGLTGFVELGHPNLFGNGQAVDLRLEKGSKTSNFEFSFTQPWFLDTPTTLGIDLFHNTLIRDIYEIKRTGGAARISRPVPGMPYTRAFGSYSFENTGGLGTIGLIDEKPITTTTVSTTGDTIVSTVQTISTPDPVQIDPSTRNTSSVTFGLSRNSTDHPTYPHTGNYSVFTSEFAGGILQGNVAYEKHTLDSRVYFKALNFPKVTKPAFMLRGQFGGIGFFGRNDPLRVPFPGDTIPSGKTLNDRFYSTEALELFRLGGTQGQALRGYSDYEVVPQENVIRRTVTSSTLRTQKGVPLTDTTSTQTVYDTFPGGRYYGIVTLERQFTIADPLHGVLFAEAGGTWNHLSDFTLGSLHKSVGFGVRMEIPLLGQVGFDYAYGFDRLNRDPDPAKGGGKYNRGGWQPHLQFGRFF